MKPLIVTRLHRADRLPDVDGVQIALETSEGPLELRLTYEDAERLVTGLQKAPLPPKHKTVERWETAIDPVNQDAVLRARYTDQTIGELRIPRPQLPVIATFLDQAAKRMEPGTDMRQ